MLEGESGILNISPPWNKPYYEPSKRRLTWPNGAIATAYSAENPELLRGPQHEKAWVDELAKFRYIDETWDNLMFGLRLGDNPQVVVTTTPKPIKLLKDVMDQDKVLLTRGSTYENKANLSDIFMDTIIERYTGTRIGRQEIYAEILDDNPEALWNREMIEKNRVFKYPELKRVVVGIDPAGTSKEKSDETGIVTAGLGEDGFIYVLDDSTLKASPDSWGSAAVTAYNKYRADRIIGEQNNGGDMVEHVVRSVDTTVSFKSVHASRGKQTRAEPVAALYEQDKVKHVGQFTELEDQMCEWDPTDQESPDRIDALVWAIWELKIQGNEFVFV